MHRRHSRNQGFTLIELSIVLVIIGLIIGGVLVGQDLVKAAETRATMGQIEKYNSAVNTFQTKYGALPGDIPTTLVAQFGFGAAPGSVRAGTAGLGNGDGLIDGYNFEVLGMWPCAHVGGENAWFWEDLSTNSHLIDETFNTATDVYIPGGTVVASVIAQYLPTAKLGKGNYISICEQSGQNYFVLSVATLIGAPSDYDSIPGLSVAQAYNIDQKIDDGLPQTGNVTAQFQNNPSSTNGAPTGNGLVWVGTVDTSATNGSPTTCYDNGGNAGQQHYSMEQNNGSGPNCALSFRMQGAAR
jgi:prepilin-type N-terminal cleavage/methylation domain-containing protein